MARPETTDDVTVRESLVATFHLDSFSTDPEAVRRYAAFIDLMKVRGGTISGTSSITVHRPRTDAELEASLESEQRQWDMREEWWTTAMETGELEYSYLRGTIRRWAETEGREVPPCLRDEATASA